VKECSKAIPRRLSQPNFLNKYFVGRGLDVGGKPDPLALYVELFGQLQSVCTWDLEDGDAQFLEGVPDESYDFVHSSHCLEHLRDPREGLLNWIRVVRPGGHVIVLVPDEDLYEQGLFPSTFNADHRWTFTIFKTQSWSPRSINLLTLLSDLGPQVDVVRIERLDATYRHALPRFDQTLTPVGECGIEVILRKRTAAEINAGGRLPVAADAAGAPPLSRDMRIHLNQYRHDRDVLRARNGEAPPFADDRPIRA
jgi:SAM-dependent methyltransferase